MDGDDPAALADADDGPLRQIRPLRSEDDAEQEMVNLLEARRIAAAEAAFMDLLIGAAGRRILRVFPCRTSHTPTDPMAFVGNPPLWRPEADEVHVSCCFTWDIPEAERLAVAWRQYYSLVRIGGPAFGDPGHEFSSGLYVKRGVTFTSRGCNRRCPWCLVPRREGKLRLMPMIPGNIVNDNNFLQTPRAHRLAVYAMLARQHEGAVFAGGLDARLVTAEVAAEFRDIRIRDVFLAADTDRALRPLEAAVSRLAFLGRDRLRCYVLIGWDGETLDRAEQRLRRVWEIGAVPFAQLYQRPERRRVEYSAEWRALARTWSRPAAMKALMRRCST